MSVNKSKNELLTHKDKSMQLLNDFLTALISTDAKHASKADKLSYWIADWVNFLEFEEKFRPTSLKRYKRGEIIKAHLGFNIGSEEGGLHYCVVLDKNNSINSPVVTVVPLTSVKANTDLSRLHNGSIHLGNELFTNLHSKAAYILKTNETHINEIRKKLDGNRKFTVEETLEIKRELNDCESALVLAKQIQRETLKMKIGSIALVNQIRTISKIRIRDPKTSRDILSGVKLSSEKLDLIDREILKLFTKAN